MKRNAATPTIAYLMLAHAIVGCCFHHVARAEDDCPRACACSGGQPELVAASCQCSHHPHDRGQSCNGSHCVYTKGEKNEKQCDVKAAVRVERPQLGVSAQSISSRFEELIAADHLSVSRQLLFQVFLI